MIEGVSFFDSLSNCQKFFPLWHMLQEPKSPLPSFSKEGNLAEFL